MFQPFGKKTQLKVVENIRNSLGTNPRKVRIISYGGPDLDVLEGCDWLVHEKRIGNGQINVWCAKENNG